MAGQRHGGTREQGRRVWFPLLLFLALVCPPLRAQEAVPAPVDVLGFVPGADSTLADWSQIGTYLSRLSNASPYVRLDTIGRTHGRRPLLLLTFATPTAQRRLAAVRRGQALLADPRRMSPETEDSLVAHQPAVVLINNNIHSTEIASSQMQLTLAHRLATDATYRTYLDSTIVLMIPSTNPDGLDTVVAWYREYRGTAYEGGPLPWLYHPYVGHDNNRDWFMLTQPETRAITRVLYEEWFPQVVWDIHQMGSNGPRLFVPPFSDPVNPNLDPMLVAATNLVGTAMGGALLDAGKTGVVHQDRYTLWWHGGFRTVPARHNMIGILSEAASARLASPIHISAESLRTPERGVNYPAPWLGGWWRMGDIVAYELLAAEGLLRLVSSQRAEFVRRFATLGRRAIAAGEAGGPAAFLIPPSQHDPHAASVLVNTLRLAGIEVQRATSPFEAGGMEHPEGTFVIPMAQPFRAHAKDLLEEQAYPDRRAYPGGPPITPYDVAGWTLGRQMGVRVEAIEHPFPFVGEPVDSVAAPRGTVAAGSPYLVIDNRSNPESGLIAGALAAGAKVWVSTETIPAEPLRAAGSVIIERTPASERLARRYADRYGVHVRSGDFRRMLGAPITRLPRIGVYRSWTASMDEGWTRWVLEEFAIPYVSVTDSMIRTGDLGATLDVLILPDMSDRAVRSGRSLTSVPPEYAGGVGEDGVRRIVEFVRGGGTLIALDGSSDFAISSLNLPVRNVLADSGSENQGSRFWAPGSIFGVATTSGLRITSGVADTIAVYFSSGRGFEVEAPARVVARYVSDPLISGYVLGPQRIAGKAALVEVPVERGRVVLFGFRPQHRGQTYGTFKLLFNAALLGAGSRPD